MCLAHNYNSKNNSIQYLLCVRFYSKGFIHVNSFSPLGHTIW